MPPQLKPIATIRVESTKARVFACRSTAVRSPTCASSPSIVGDIGPVGPADGLESTTYPSDARSSNSEAFSYADPPDPGAYSTTGNVPAATGASRSPRVSHVERAAAPAGCPANERARSSSVDGRWEFARLTAGYHNMTRTGRPGAPVRGSGRLLSVIVNARTPAANGPLGATSDHGRCAPSTPTGRISTASSEHLAIRVISARAMTRFRTWVDAGVSEAYPLSGARAQNCSKISRFHRARTVRIGSSA